MPVIRTRYVYMSNDMRIRFYFFNPKWVRGQKILENAGMNLLVSILQRLLGHPCLNSCSPSRHCVWVLVLLNEVGGNTSVVSLMASYMGGKNKQQLQLVWGIICKSCNRCCVTRCWSACGRSDTLARWARSYGSVMSFTEPGASRVG
jgi:hypothetical protein